MSKPTDEGNFLIEVSVPLYERIKQELGGAFIDNMELHYSPYWKAMSEREEPKDE